MDSAYLASSANTNTPPDRLSAPTVSWQTVARERIIERADGVGGDTPDRDRGGEPVDQAAEGEVDTSPAPADDPYFLGGSDLGDAGRPPVGDPTQRVPAERGTQPRSRCSPTEVLSTHASGVLARAS